ncbi:TatD family hydrolase [Candidatus Saccharibacteria bacterium]|nr:TatD family hydrolase [Candidatus Saccharibacteria bacterium]
MLIDSHCHLHDKEFYTAKQAEDCLKRAEKFGVKKIVCIGTSHEDSLAAAEFASKHDYVYWTYGIHPSETGKTGFAFSSAGLEFLSTSYAGTPGEPSLRDEPLGCVDQRSDLRCRNRRVKNSNQIFTLQKGQKPILPVAIGEVGLDYHDEGYDRAAQIRLFEQMLQLAKDNDLPLSFHVRGAFPDFFAVVANFPKARGVVHSFTGSKKVLKRILNETDFYIGVNGLATYSTLPMPPLERIMLETDAPFLAPKGFRNQTNEPSHILDIANWLAETLDSDFSTVEKVTTANTEALFKL